MEEKKKLGILRDTGKSISKRGWENVERKKRFKNNHPPKKKKKNEKVM